MKKNETISNLQIKNLLITTVIGVGILALPNQMVTILDNDGWIPIIFGGLLVIPFAVMLDRVYKLYPDKNIYQIGREVYGKFIFNIFMIIILMYFVIQDAYVARIFAEVVKAYLLETTPIEVIIITILLVSAYLARCEIQVLGRVATLVYVILITLVGFLVLISLPDADPTNMLPVFNADFKKLPSAITGALFSYAGYEVVFIAYSSSDDKNNILKYIIRGLLVVIGIYLIVFVITLSLFGIDQIKRELWPTIAIANEVDLPGYFLENLEGIVLALWVVVVYSTLGPLLFAASRIFLNIFTTKSHDFIVLLLIPIIYVISILPVNVVEVYEKLGKVLNYFIAVSIIGIPAILFIGALVKKRRSKA